MLKEILFGIVIIIGVLYFVDNLRWFVMEDVYSLNNKFCVFDNDCYPARGCVNVVAAVKKYGLQNVTLSITPPCKCVMRGCVTVLPTPVSNNS